MIDAEVVELAEQPTAAVRATVAMTDIRGFFDEAFGELFAALATEGVAPAGPPYARYRGMPTSTVDVEVGVPVAAALAATGRVAPAALPACRAATAVHVGGYEGLSATYAALAAWAGSEGLRLADGMWEVYLTDPTAVPDESALRTRVVWPLVGDPGRGTE